MHILPKSKEEFTLWKLNGDCIFQDTGQDTDAGVNSVHNNDDIWQWIILYGGPLFSKHIQLKIEVDELSLLETHVVSFDNKIISVTSAGVTMRNFRTVYELQQHLVGTVHIVYVTV
jgi:hypothetical protein